MNLSRSHAAEIARETDQITRDGHYTDAASREQNIAVDTERASDQTRSYPPDWMPEFPGQARFETRVEVNNETTLRAARRLMDDGFNAVALNFASAKHVGGGWLNGARAQEEYLCRHSTLAHCLGNQPDFYEFHQTHRAPQYSSWMLYSPAVPVIRDEDNDLMAPWPQAFITAAAPNLNNGMAMPTRELNELWRERIARVFDVALHHDHDALILGAWGCGAFKNDPNIVTEAFADVIQDYDGQFKMLSFAVLDVGLTQGNYEPFARHLNNI